VLGEERVARCDLSASARGVPEVEGETGCYCVMGQREHEGLAPGQPPGCCKGAGALLVTSGRGERRRADQPRGADTVTVCSARRAAIGQGTSARRESIQSASINGT